MPVEFLARAPPECGNLAASTKVAAGFAADGRLRIKRLLNADGNARQIYANGGAINHRRWSVVIR